MAKQVGVAFSVEAGVPRILSISDTELCSLLSKSFENAIIAASAVPTAGGRVVSVRIAVHKRRFL